MKRELRQRWIEALRSGRYKQTTGQIGTNKGPNCCLGVLCRIARVPYKLWREDHELQDPLIHIEQRLGLSRDQITHLIHLNDGYTSRGIRIQPHSFEQIADYLEGRMRRRSAR